MAGCVFSVSFSSSSGPEKQSCDSENPSTRSASSKTRRATGNESASSRPMPAYCDPWPGKRNTTPPIWIPRLLQTGGLCPNRNWQRGKLSLDPFVQSHMRHFGGYPHRILYGIGVRPAMPDDGDAAHAQQRRSAIFGIINVAPKFLVSAPRKHVTHLRGDGALERFFKHRGDVLGHSLADFQGHIADKAVAHDDVHAAGKDVASFDIADEIERQLFEPVVGLFCELIALGFFLAYGEQSHLRPSRTEDGAVINLPHDGKLHQVAHLRIYIRAGVDQDRHASPAGRKRSGQRRPLDGRKRAEDETRHGHERAGIPGADQRIRLTRSHQSGSYVRGAVLFAAEGLRGWIAHGDHLACRYHFDRQASHAVPGQFALNLCGYAYQQNSNTEFTGR